MNPVGRQCVNITRFFAIFTPPLQNPSHHRVEPMEGPNRFQNPIEPKITAPEVGHLMQEHPPDLLDGKLAPQIQRHE
jgi:hypothetical protein